MSIIGENDERHVRMAYLAIVGSHKVNGVSRLHAELMRSRVFADFDRVFPGRIVGKTNGITTRRWLQVANPELSALITSQIGDGWQNGSRAGAYLDDYRSSPAGDGSNKAWWTFTDLAEGTYEALATWVPWNDTGSWRATNAPYTVFDGTTILGTVRVNQEVDPVGLDADLE